MQFFGLTGIALIAVGLLAAFPLAQTYFDTGLVPRLPTAVLVVGMTIIGVLNIFVGLILDGVTTMRQEMKRLAYLSEPPPGARLDTAPRQ